EDLAASTGCWLFVGAQHCSGVGATVHYTSPRLLRDAREPMNEIANDFHELMTTLLQSRRTDALTLSRKLKKAEEDKEVMDKKVEHMSDKLATQEDKLANQERLLQLYASRLGIDPDTLSQ
ncbi:hypothetical protein GALMADRAFT_71426, partial [Galerina marginata CBS 339.88]